ncbi:MAG: hypothetical protein SNJ79_08815 [Sphingomonadaceae bacterium]
MLAPAPALAADASALSIKRSSATELPGFRLRVHDADSTGKPLAQPLDLSRFNFTASGDPAARLKPAGPEKSFRFTPSRSADRRALSAGVTSRAVTAVAPAAPAPAPTSVAAAAPGLRGVMAAGAETPAAAGYGVGMSVDWQGFSLQGAMARAPEGLGLREQFDAGLTYGGRRWRTGILASAERGSSLLSGSVPGEIERFGVEATGAVNVSRSFSVRGGVRYRSAPLSPTLLEPNKEEEAVYVGGALAF